MNTAGNIRYKIKHLKNISIISFCQGEKAYSCALCGTRFTYRNGLIKHTKLNRCPKKQFTSDSEKYSKKKSKNIENIKIQKEDPYNGPSSHKEVATNFLFLLSHKCQSKTLMLILSPYEHLTCLYCKF